MGGDRRGEGEKGGSEVERWVDDGGVEGGKGRGWGVVEGLVEGGKVGEVVQEGVMVVDGRE